VIVQITGIGYYGDRGDELVDETSSYGQGFIVGVAREWEKSIKPIETLSVRLVILRTSVVLGKGGGLLSRVLLPFRFFIGGHLGNGKNWISWIHIKDWLEAIRFVLEKNNISGVLNLTSPNPHQSKDFYRTLGNVMKRPSWFPVPGFLLKLMLGDMAKELILSGQRAIPNRLLKLGFNFQYPNLKDAFQNILP